MKITKPYKEFKIVAHRGLPNTYPENTMVGYKAALMHHIDMLEIDIHLTKDNQLVIIHDDKLDRTSNGKGLITNYTLEELKSFDFGSYKDISYQDETIPTLEEVLQTAKHFSKQLLIEIKKPNQYPNIEKILLETLKRHNIPEHRVIIQSFDIESIERLYKINCPYELGVLCSKKKYWYKRPDFAKIAQYATYANPNYMLVTKQFIKEAHKVGLKVLPYTVNKNKVAQKMINYGVDGLITDVPFDIFKL
ncbi:glycerophosphodiester phosphodiesterase [Staphylococcus simiae]|uniref:Glycerophosphoryl diester phosphodiesterase n=1 Tax=Staphylococcus simiae CCM 7213 = CCUG 51256 TaxID=911238 RepID=G5JI75_9STAP|nr:glycerophosphodiester phosphodiesterase family protein [Staphylococcus simiae]EHJ08110.1 glycerophosphoryl diester phosphodiesterase [Staphylococcus simiae CCM 7213 = CCUG 51256]PNZ12115.1 glycerophosphodiester phosphodiesterase [Staphylococcus simiae]SNV74577.1 glycerophosphoryl diester phosphodiesterase protein [Staphylococcus simiae]